MPEPIRIISATRATAAEFDTTTFLGRSLQALRKLGDFETRIAYENAEGLPTIYNRAIDEAKHLPAVLVFVHDDVYIADTLWIDEIRQCLTLLDVLGMAGNRRRVPRQPAWAFTHIADDGQFVWDHPQYLSGIVGKGDPPSVMGVSVFGDPHQQCVLLDGLMLVARSSVLNDRGVRFDPQFPFHFYDMDFCRQAELQGLKMGTMAMKLIHRSGGNPSPEWHAAYQAYLRKYGS